MTPRITLPKQGDPFYTAQTEGGLNPCIPRPKGSVLRFANCVFYAVGRYAELWGVWLPSKNAEDLWAAAQKMCLRTGQTPEPGALIVWAKGKTGDGSDGAGHVAAVEIVNTNGSIVTSESGWNANKPFWTQTRRKDGNYGQGSGYRLLGFILPPVQATPGRKTVREGDRGDDVKAMQERLAALGYLRKQEIDGDYGKITKGALLCFQFEAGLDVDAVCGPKTWAKLTG